MDLFILLFRVYLIVAVTRSECVSASGLTFCVLDFCRSLPDPCVYLSPESSTLNTCVSPMRVIKFDELKNVLTVYLTFVSSLLVST